MKSIKDFITEDLFGNIGSTMSTKKPKINIPKIGDIICENGKISSIKSGKCLIKHARDNINSINIKLAQDEDNFTRLAIFGKIKEFIFGTKETSVQIFANDFSSWNAEYKLSSDSFFLQNANNLNIYNLDITTNLLVIDGNNKSIMFNKCNIKHYDERYASIQIYSEELPEFAGTKIDVPKVELLGSNNIYKKIYAETWDLLQRMVRDKTARDMGASFDPYEWIYKLVGAKNPPTTQTTLYIWNSDRRSRCVKFLYKPKSIKQGMISFLESDWWISL